MEVDATTAAAAEVPVPPASPEPPAHSSAAARVPSHPIPFPDHDPSIGNETSSGLFPLAHAASLKQPLPNQVSSQQQRHSAHSLHDAINRLHQMEQHMHHTFHQVNKQFIDMQQQHASDMAALADSLVQVDQRVDNLATDMSTQMQNMTAMLHTLMAHVGITP